MRELAVVLDAFHDATKCEAAVWTQRDSDGAINAEAAAPATATPPKAGTLAGTGPPVIEHLPHGQRLVAVIPGPKRAWLTVGPCAAPTHTLEAYLKFLLPVVGQYLQASMEVEHAANELAERYEEINLLYTISEILGRTVTLEEAAATILTEISETVGARKASILVHDRVTDTLQVVAALGVSPLEAPPIAADDQCSVSARVFRTQHPQIVEPDEMRCPAEESYRRGAMLSVPIMWTTPEGGEPLGVVNLSDRRAGHPFTAGDQKLVAAIATQIGTAIQNARLVRASLNQQRLVSEMQLAHDLQMRLLPAPAVVAPNATVAARVVPADSVGGDLYNLFRLPQRRTGVMIGDVSGHGYRAALIMALAMSASAIHAQTTNDPGETLTALLASLRDELATTEMFISAFYAVIDPERHQLYYANTGHPHAFVISAAGDVERLPALDPPLGMVETSPNSTSRPWKADELLLLFTDGISEARNRQDDRLGESAVLDIVLRNRAAEPAKILEAVFEALNQHIGDTPRRDDLTLVLVRG